MPERDELLARLSRFEKHFFPRFEKNHRRLVEDGHMPVLGAERGGFDPEP
jgi:hypothetical protein